MVIEPLPIWEEEEEQKALEKLTAPDSMVVRFGHMKQIGEFPYQGNEIPGCGTKLVLKTPRGVEIGDMLTTLCSNGGCSSSVSRKQMLEYIDNSGGKQYPFTNEGKVLRVATIEDLNEQANLDNSKPQYIRTAREHIKELNLEMKVIDAEVLLGGDRVIFYFTAEDRIDFRDLVKKLATDCHSRIEMRQVGARDEARLIADYEKCGQQCCCKQFLKVLKPISMKSAKVQKATLDPTKISGRCGRLMCCLRYEDENYNELRKNLPNRNSYVNTEDGPGRVVNSQILTQLVLVELNSNGQRQAYPVEHIEKLTKEDIDRIREEQIARDEQQQARIQNRKPSPASRQSQQQSQRPQGQPPQPQPHQPNLTNQQPQQDARPQNAPGQGGEGQEQPTKKKRRRRKRKKSANSDGAPQVNVSQQQEASPQQNAPQQEQQNNSEPPRPKPGQPLQDDQVQNKEGQPHQPHQPDQQPNPTQPTQPTNQPQNDNSSNLQPVSQANASSNDTSENPTKKKRRRRRRRRSKGGGGGSGDSASNNTPS